MKPIEGRERLLITRHRNHAAYDPRALARGIRSGEMRKLRSGAVVLTSVWKALSFEDRRRLEVAAAVDAGRDGLIVSHRSAGALWGVPSILRDDGLVHVRATIAAGTRTEHGFRKHAVADLDQHVVEVEGLRLTTLPRTVVDIALSDPFAEAVVAVDWALRYGLSKEQLRTTLDEAAPKQGRARAEKAILFGDPASGSPGESRSRAQMELGGLVMPVLQERFEDDDGLIGFVDFYWPQFDLIGEFDGLKKYREAELLGDRTPGEVVVAEKDREDRLRATTTRPKVTRWTWAVLDQRGGLMGQLLRAGVRRR